MYEITITKKEASYTSISPCTVLGFARHFDQFSRTQVAEILT